MQIFFKKKQFWKKCLRAYMNSGFRALQKHDFSEQTEQTEQTEQFSCEQTEQNMLYYVLG